LRKKRRNQRPLPQLTKKKGPLPLSLFCRFVNFLLKFEIKSESEEKK